MSLKDVQIFNHRHYRLIRNVCVGVILVALFIVPGVLQIQRLDHQTVQLEKQAQEIKDLTQQVKDLSKRNVELGNQNVALNQQNVRHTDCVATVFAQFTHDNIPVSFKDLDSCSITTGTSGSSSPNRANSLSSPSKTPTSSSASASGQATSPASSSGSSSSSNNSSTPPQTSQSKILPLNCKVDLLGIHLGCP